MFHSAEAVSETLLPPGCWRLTRRGHFAAVHVLVEIEDLVPDRRAVIVQRGGDELRVERVGSDLPRGDVGGEVGGRGQGWVGELGVLAYPPVEMVIAELRSSAMPAERGH